MEWAQLIWNGQQPKTKMEISTRYEQQSGQISSKKHADKMHVPAQYSSCGAGRNFVYTCVIHTLQRWSIVQSIGYTQKLFEDSIWLSH